jgi:predicted phage terminase large subunit-like protein
MPTRDSAVSREAARRELKRREQAFKELLAYGEYLLPFFKVYRHQQLIAEKLQGVEEYVVTRGASGIGRLMIETQPQVGKSLTASNLWPSWELGRYPDWNFILTSYNDARAHNNSKAVRDLVMHPRYRNVFGDRGVSAEQVSISSDQRSVSEWSLAQPHRGGVFAAGVGGGVTGHPGNVIIIDDPFKSREEAESQARRDLVSDWYESQIYSRQQEGMAIILFHTRWNQDDLAGRMIKAMVANPRADRWEILCMPALALEASEYPQDDEAQRKLMLDGVYLPLADPLARQPGEALCPEMLSRETLESIRDNMNAYNFQSLYQQLPFLRSGGKFKRQWFKIEAQIPDEIKFSKSVWYWDQAAKEGAGDYSAGVLMAMDQHSRIWVLVVARDQYSTFTRRQAMRSAYAAALARFGQRVPVPQLWHQQDPGSAGLDSARDTNKALAGLPAHFEPVSGDKETRADPWSSALESDNVVLLKGSWNQPFIDEHLSFPKGRNDDQVDAVSSAYTKLTGGVEVGMVAYAQKQLDRIKAEKDQAAKELADGTQQN